MNKSTQALMLAGTLLASSASAYEVVAPEHIALASIRAQTNAALINAHAPFCLAAIRANPDTLFTDSDCEITRQATDRMEVALRMTQTWVHEEIAKGATLALGLHGSADTLLRASELLNELTAEMRAF